MSDEGDNLLRAAGAELRRREGLGDPRWEALARGQATEEERAALRGLPDPDGSEEALFDLVEPGDEEANRTATLALWKAHANKKSDDRAPPNDAGGAPTIDLPEPARAPAKDRKILRRSLPAWAFAAATILLLSLGAGGMWVAMQPRARDLPEYALSVQGGAAMMLGDPDAGSSPISLDRGMRVAFVLSPEQAPSGALRVSAFLVRPGQTRPWRVTPLVNARGEVRVEGAAEELFRDVPDGPWEATFVVGLSDAFPDEAALAERISAWSAGPRDRHIGPGVRVIARPIVLVPRTGGAEDRAPTIELGGCAAVSRAAGQSADSRACAVRMPGSLRVWVATSAPENLNIDVDGHAASIAPVALQGGIAADVPIPAGAAKLTIRVAAETRSHEQAWTIAPFARSPVLTEIDALRGQGKLHEARAKIAAAEQGADPGLAAELLRSKARLALAAGTAAEATPLFTEAILRARAEGRFSEEVSDRLALSHAQIYAGKWAEAEKTLEGVREIPDPEGMAKAALYWGELYQEEVNPRRALAAFRTAVLGAERLGLRGRQRDALHMMGLMLVELGRSQEAQLAFASEEALSDPKEPPCNKAQRDSNRGFAVLNAARSGADIARATAWIVAAGRADLAACDPVRREVLANLVLAQVRGGDATQARSALREAQSSAGNDLRLGRFFRRMEAEILLLEGAHAKALERFKALEKEAAESDLPDLATSSALGQARAFEGLGRAEDATTMFERAEDRLRAFAPRVPLGDGRDTFFQVHSNISESHVDFLIRQAERQTDERRLALWNEAQEVARAGLAEYAKTILLLDRDLPEVERSALAAYRSERKHLEQRAGQLSPSEKKNLLALRVLAAGGVPDPAKETRDLSPIAPGEVALFAHRTRTDWALFAVRARSDGAKIVLETKVKREEGSLSEEAVSGRLAGAFPEWVTADTRVRFSAWGASAGADGRAGKATTFSLDVPVSRSQGVSTSFASQGDAGAPGLARKALVVLDPENDARHTRDRGREVVSLLGADGLLVKALWREQATKTAILAALTDPETACFHFGGHAELGGNDGAESRLRLAAGEGLTVREILALPRVPELVVLMGCETGQAGDAGRGLGLAHAFILRGARVVVASDRPILDKVAGDASADLYRRSHLTTPDLAEALSLGLRATQVGLSVSASPAEQTSLWALRVLVR